MMMLPKVTEIAVPGCNCRINSSTNPTSTVIYKALISLKAANSIVFSPHPNALKSIIETVEIIQKRLLLQGTRRLCLGHQNANHASDQRINEK